MNRVGSLAALTAVALVSCGGSDDPQFETTLELGELARRDVIALRPQTRATSSSAVELVRSTLIAWTTADPSIECAGTIGPYLSGAATLADGSVVTASTTNDRTSALLIRTP